MTRYIVMTASAHMPNSCFGTYRRVGVVETSLPEGETPKMLSPRARGVVRIVETWERCHAGRHARVSVYDRALQDARQLRDQLAWEQRAATAFGE